MIPLDETELTSCLRLPLFSASAAARSIASFVSGAANPLVIVKQPE